MAKLNQEQVDQILKSNGLATSEEQSALDVSLDEINSFGDKDSIKEIYTDIANYNRMIREKITFCNDSLTKAIPFTRENLYLMCAYSGNGKSTIAANISFPLWKEGKKTLIISNEEDKKDILFRIGCLELGLNFNDFKKGHMAMEDQLKVSKMFPEISQYAKVLDVNYKNGLTTKVEGVKNALEAVKNEDFSCIMIDYFQLIKFSVERPNAKTYEVLNDFRIWLGQFIKRANMPVVLFAQLHSQGKRNNKDLDSRIKDCPTIYEPATVVIEVIPNFEDKTSDFLIHKDRFGLSGQRITCGFQHGRYVNMTPEYLEEIRKREADRKIKEAEAALDDLEDTAEEGIKDGSI